MAGIRWGMVFARWERLPGPSPPWTCLCTDILIQGPKWLQCFRLLAWSSAPIEALFINANNLFCKASLYFGWHTVFREVDVTWVTNVWWQISSILSNFHVKSTCMYLRLYTACVLAQARLNPPGARKEKQRFITVIKFQPSRDEVKWEQQSTGYQESRSYVHGSYQ